MGPDTQTLRDSVQFRVTAIPELWSLENVINQEENKIEKFIKSAPNFLFR